MLEQKVIELPQNEWAAPIVFAPKKDGTMRFCYDYMRLIALETRDLYPISCVEEWIESLGKATASSTYDANSGFWHGETDEKDCDKTAFTSDHGLYRFIRSPLRLWNAPDTFHSKMDVALSSVKWSFAIVYLNNIVNFSKSPKQHIDHVRKVIEPLKNAGVTRELKKRRFLRRLLITWDMWYVQDARK